MQMGLPATRWKAHLFMRNAAYSRPCRAVLFQRILLGLDRNAPDDTVGELAAIQVAVVNREVRRGGSPHLQEREELRFLQSPGPDPDRQQRLRCLAQ